MTAGSSPPILVLGVGNLLWADEGFGVRCVEELVRGWSLPPQVEVLDGGTQGLYLVPHVTAAERLIVVDAIDYGDPPGTLRVVRGDEVPRFTGARALSLHQVGFQDVLAAAALLDACPRELVLIGVQAGDLDDWGGTLTPALAARVDETVAAVIAELTAWGAAPVARAAPGPPLVADAVGRAAYEDRGARAGGARSRERR